MTPLDYLVQTLWPGITAWTILYVSDYYCTLFAARMIKQGVDNHIGLEKGYELTPYYQADIAKLRPVSGRFVLQLALSNLLLVVTWYLSGAIKIPEFYEFCLGALILIELTIHVRHMRNLGTYLYYRGSHGIDGKITFAHWLQLRLSGLDILAFGILWILISLITFRWFFVGGAFKCLATAQKHWQLSNKERNSNEKSNEITKDRHPDDVQELLDSESVH